MQNGYVESFNGRMRDELLNETLFMRLAHARVEIAVWVEDYNRERPHSSLDYEIPAAFAAKLNKQWPASTAQMRKAMLCHLTPGPFAVKFSAVDILGWVRSDGMKASKFTDAQKAFVIKQGEEGTGGGDLPQGRDQLGDLLQLEEEIRGAYAVGDAADARTGG